MNDAKDVDTYIAHAPHDVRDKLKALRTAIKAAAPLSMEKISYGMPYYGYKGRLAYFAYAKKHIGLYIPPSITVLFKAELKDYETSMATIRFPLDKKLPVSLIKKLVRNRVKLNDAAAKNK